MPKYTDPNALSLFDFNKHPTNYQPNVLTQSRQEFTELEKKIVVLVVNQIGHMSLRGEIRPNQNVTVYVPFTELTRDRHNQIGAAAESLQLKRLGYRDDQEQQFDYIVPFPRIRSIMQQGRRVIELTMFADVVPYFADLGQRYTKYDIDVMLSLGSVYAQRMFEIVSMFYNRNQSVFSYDVDELRSILNVPEGYSYNDFRKNALLVAQRELQTKAQLSLDWRPTRKQGKRILRLEFAIKTDRQLALEGVEQDRQQVNQLPHHEAVAMAWRLMSHYDLKPWQKERVAADPNLLEIFFRVDAELANGLRPQVKNPTAYLIKSLGLDQEKKPKATRKAQKPSLDNAPTLPLGSATRMSDTQSLAAIIVGMKLGDQ
jgi:hypothetical protein